MGPVDLPSLRPSFMSRRVLVPSNLWLASYRAMDGSTRLFSSLSLTSMVMHLPSSLAGTWASSRMKLEADGDEPQPVGFISTTHQKRG